MRTPGTILSTVALFWGFLQAPFSHIHPEDLDHPAAPALVHMHVHEQAAAAGPLIGAHTADDDVIEIGWNALRSSVAGFSFDFTPARAMTVPAPKPVSAPALIPDWRGHDPPYTPPKPPRSPPA